MVPVTHNFNGGSLGSLADFPEIVAKAPRLDRIMHASGRRFLWWWCIKEAWWWGCDVVEEKERKKIVVLCGGGKLNVVLEWCRMTYMKG
ncbi:hypothetical protein RJT34_12945 [Clitoria ternatea]|uniref:Uncharacterized protein n=1 Tax=Clitoria ternatea TaxID=43366 RepID=A0AAN9JPR5_CLITE